MEVEPEDGVGRADVVGEIPALGVDQDGSVDDGEVVVQEEVDGGELGQIHREGGQENAKSLLKKSLAELAGDSAELEISLNLLALKSKQQQTLKFVGLLMMLRSARGSPDVVVDVGLGLARSTENSTRWQ